MDKFTASNGVGVERFTESLNVETPTSGAWLEPQIVTALREFFQAERDEDLGWWRPDGRRDVWVLADSDNPNRILIVSDTLSTFATWTRDGIQQTRANGGWAGSIARAYFNAHPERKPWHDAKHGEVWVITVDGETHAAYVDRESTTFPRFITPHDDMGYGPNAGITAGRRIYPEVSDADR